MVSVPVLSEQMAVAFPIVSQASRWRTKLLSFIIFWHTNNRESSDTEFRFLNPYFTISSSHNLKILLCEEGIRYEAKMYYNVFWSDKTKIALFGLHAKNDTWYTCNNVYHPKLTIFMAKHGSGSIMHFSSRWWEENLLRGCKDLDLEELITPESTWG